MGNKEEIRIKRERTKKKLDEKDRERKEKRYQRGKRGE